MNRTPYFSICIPQHNRTSFLLRACQSLAEQTFRDFEVCISDDCSSDGRQEEIKRYLDRAGFPYVFHSQDRNQRYDGNLRAAIGLARGRYCLLLGNDDALAGPEALLKLRGVMDAHGPAGVVIPNYEDYATGKSVKRIQRTANYGGGPEVAAGHFRNLSFVSGVVLEREAAQAVATDRWDGSEMYQTYVGCRLIASGRPLLETKLVLIRKDIQIEGEAVDNYAHRLRENIFSIRERRLPLAQLGRLAADAIAPFADKECRSALNERILWQLWLFTYPFWIVEYRRVQSWRYAAGVCLGMRPAVVMAGLHLNWLRRLRLQSLYALVTTCGLAVPVRIFRLLQAELYRWSKAYRWANVSS